MNNSPSTSSDFLLYSTENGEIKIDVFLQDKTIWLSQKSMANLFDVSIPTINEHLKNIFSTGELEEFSVIRNFRTTASDGKNYQVNFYNLDAIISVGYRVSSFRATQFRIWATKILSEYIVKGFVMDDARLKQGKKVFGDDYFQELLERIRDIRTSEKIFYEKIKDLYATSVDYADANPKVKNDFFASVQNKIHFGLLGKTAAEIVFERADEKVENMGLKTWKNAPQGKIRKDDIAIAKNYLKEEELKKYNLFVSMLLDHAEMQALERNQMKISDWEEVIDDFLKFQKKPILESKGKISADQAEKKALDCFSQFVELQKSFQLLKK